MKSGRSLFSWQEDDLTWSGLDILPANTTNKIRKTIINEALIPPSSSNKSSLEEVAYVRHRNAALY